MDTTLITDLLAALAAEPRVKTIAALTAAGDEGMSPTDLAAHCGVAPSTMSFHLNHLRMAGLVESHREGRRLTYVVNREALEALSQVVARGFCPAPAGVAQQAAGAPAPGPGGSTPLPGGVPPAMEGERPLRVLFLCTNNSARSIMAEALLQKEGGGRFIAHSAGSHPRDAVHPQALDTLRRAGVPTDGVSSKSWDIFSRDQADAPDMDLVFTVCDDAAAEACPAWPGQPIRAHWGVPDPAAFRGGPAETAAVFQDVFRMLANRIALLVNLPLSSLDRLALQHHVEAIGKMPRDPQATALPPDTAGPGTGPSA